LGAVLDGRHGDRRKVEHLSADLAGDRCVTQVITTRLAVIRGMVDDLVGFSDRREVLIRCTGLLADLLPRPTTTRLRCRLHVPVRRWWLRGVLRVQPEPCPQPLVVSGQGEVRSFQLVQPLDELSESGPE
jgi:hypothetical protein